MTGPAATGHEPAGYDCPFCRLATDGQDPLDPRGECIITNTGAATALISPRWWPNNQGHALVIPNQHHENLYALPAVAGHAVHDLTRLVAVAMRASYGCTGISVRQHNEPDGGQDVWHYHVHVLPRYPDDRLYQSDPLAGFASVEQRRPYADRLRAVIEGQRE